MKPKIEDYSPYYIGGQIHTGKTGLATNLGLFYSYTPGELGEISPAPTGLTLFFKELGQKVDQLAVIEFDSEDYQDCKLAVRPFSKLTPEEAIFIATQVFFYQYEMDFTQIKAQKYINDIWLIFYQEAANDLKVSITQEGQIGIFDPTQQRYVDCSHRHLHRLTPWYLKQNLDVFNLIAAGVAMDITKASAIVPQQSPEAETP